MENQPPTWKHDPTEPFASPVYRRGPWHFQASPAAITMLALTWLGLIAVHLPNMHRIFQEHLMVVRLVQYAGLLCGSLMTLILLTYHHNRWQEKRALRPRMSPYTIGILEHTTVVLFMALVISTIAFP